MACRAWATWSAMSLVCSGLTPISMASPAVPSSSFCTALTMLTVAQMTLGCCRNVQTPGRAVEPIDRPAGLADGQGSAVRYQYSSAWALLMDLLGMQPTRLRAITAAIATTGPMQAAG